MDWTKLFTMQKELDRYIELNHHLSDQNDLFRKKHLALLVELGELANETRCFKFWSTKARSPKPIILEEFVDGVHFILSLGLVKGLRFSSQVEEPGLDETDQFNKVFEASMSFKSKPTQDHYNELFINFLQLGKLLGFSEEDIQKAYMAKNEENYKRQNEGY